jgi:antirestriction protein ArdC
VDGFNPEPTSDRPDIEPIEAGEAFVRATGATSTAQESYYSTLLHELTHWTAPEQRCNRTLGNRFGDDAYAMEELVPELGAVFLCTKLGFTLEPRLDHAQYLTSWLSVLKADKKAIFAAASAASTAVEFLSAGKASASSS